MDCTRVNTVTLLGTITLKTTQLFNRHLCNCGALTMSSPMLLKKDDAADMN